MDQIAGGAFAVANTLGTKRRHDLDQETYVKVIRSGARDENGDLPAEVWAERDVAPTLNTIDNTGESRAAVIAFGHRQGLDIQPSEHSFPTLRAGDHGAAVARTLTARHDSSPDGDRGFNIIPDGLAVRRLTPVETERLQGFPDGWTEGQTDGHRYRQMGNAVAVPVVSWVMERLVAVSKKEDTE